MQSSGPNQQMRTKLPRTLSAVPSKKNQKKLFPFCGWKSLLPSSHFDAATPLWLPHCQTGDGLNNCLYLNEGEQWTWYFIFIGGNQREEHSTLCQEKKKQESNFTDTQFKFLLWRFTMLDQRICNFPDSHSDGLYSHIIRTETCLPPFKMPTPHPRVVSVKI